MSVNDVMNGVGAPVLVGLAGVLLVLVCIAVGRITFEFKLWREQRHRLQQQRRQR